MEKFEGLPTDFRKWVNYELRQIENLKIKPAIMLLKTEDESVPELLWGMDYDNSEFEGETIDYVAMHEDKIGLYFQNGKGKIRNIKDKVIYELNRRRGSDVEFEKVGFASYEKGDSIESILKRAY
mgnify:CR=1 FL=1